MKHWSWYMKLRWKLQKNERDQEIDKNLNYAEGEEASFMTYGDDEPATYEEALHRPDRSMWKEDIKIELKTLEQNNTWEEVVDRRTEYNQY